MSKSDFLPLWNDDYNKLFNFAIKTSFKPNLLHVKSGFLEFEHRPSIYKRNNFGLSVHGLISIYIIDKLWKDLLHFLMELQFSLLHQGTSC